MKYKVVDLIKFKSEKKKHKIRACDDRFIIATKPFNLQRTFLYTIIDLKDKVRGPDNWGCRFNYEDSEEAAKCLPLLHLSPTESSDSVEINSRRLIKLDIEE